MVSIPRIPPSSNNNQPPRRKDNPWANMPLPVVGAAIPGTSVGPNGGLFINGQPVVPPQP